MFKASKKRSKKSQASTARTKTRRMRKTPRRRKTRRRSNKWGTVGTVLKLAVGAYAGNLIGAQIGKYTGNQGPLFRVGGGVVGAIAAKKAAAW
jgi:hypothetical protein